MPKKLCEEFSPKQKSGTRIDALLAENYPTITRELFKKELKKGSVLVNGEKVKPNYITREHDRITVDFTPEGELTSATPDPSISINVVYEHSDFLIIEKPAGISIHPSEKERTGTLANGILAKFPELAAVGESPIRPGIVHRLDKFTSGLILVTRNQASFLFFKNLFKSRKIQKHYIAACWGIFTKKEGACDLFIGKSRANSLKQSASKYENKLINPKSALTEYSVIKESLEKDISLVRVILKTGRKHQIRVHFHALNHPVIGDKTYQTKVLRDKNADFERFFLHASYLEFTYTDNKKYTFDSPMPQVFLETFE